MPDVLGFLRSEVNHIETQAYMTKYPDIQYSMLVPVDTEAPEWVRGVTHFSHDITGRAQFLGNRANDIPLADITRAQHDVIVETASIGYDYTEEELNQAMLIPGRNLTAEKAIAARRAAEEFIDDICLLGSPDHSWDGLVNNTNVPVQDAPDGTGGSPQWNNKSGDEIIADITSLLGGLWEGTRTVELADTLCLPPSAWNHISSTPRSTYSDLSILEWVRRYNVYTAETGSQLMIKVLRGLENAADSGGTPPGGSPQTQFTGTLQELQTRSAQGRALAYRRDPSVLKFYMPMPFRFGTPQQWMYRYVVPGMMRLGGLEVRRPQAMRYMDNIWA